MVRSIPHDGVKGHLRLQSQPKVFHKEIQPLDIGGPWHTSAQDKSRSTRFHLEEHKDTPPNIADFII